MDDVTWCLACGLDLVGGRCPECDTPGGRTPKPDAGPSWLAASTEAIATRHPETQTVVTVVVVLVVAVLALALMVAAAAGAFILGLVMGAGGAFAAVRVFPALASITPNTTTTEQAPDAGTRPKDPT